MKKLTTLAISLTLAIGIFAFGSFVLADSYGLDKTAEASGLDKAAPKEVTTIIGNIIGNALSLTSVIFFILMIYGGFRWMLARGNDEDSKKALDTIIAAIIGIIIILASYAITNFVFNSLGSASTTTTTPPGTIVTEDGADDDTETPYTSCIAYEEGSPACEFYQFSFNTEGGGDDLEDIAACEQKIGEKMEDGPGFEYGFPTAANCNSARNLMISCNGDINEMRYCLDNGCLPDSDECLASSETKNLDKNNIDKWQPCATMVGC